MLPKWVLCAAALALCLPAIVPMASALEAQAVRLDAGSPHAIAGGFYALNDNCLPRSGTRFAFSLTDNSDGTWAFRIASVDPRGQSIPCTITGGGSNPAAAYDPTKAGCVRTVDNPVGLNVQLCLGAVPQGAGTTWAGICQQGFGVGACASTTSVTTVRL